MRILIRFFGSVDNQIPTDSFIINPELNIANLVRNWMNAYPKGKVDFIRI